MGEAILPVVRGQMEDRIVGCALQRRANVGVRALGEFEGSFYRNSVVRLGKFGLGSPKCTHIWFPNELLDRVGLVHPVFFDKRDTKNTDGFVSCDRQR